MGMSHFCCDKYKNEENTLPPKTEEDELIKDLQIINNDEEEILKQKQTFSKKSTLKRTTSLNVSLHEELNYNIINKIIFFFEKFELTYKLIDDFGLSFNPVLFIKVPPSQEYTYNPIQVEGQGNKEGEALSDNSLIRNDNNYNNLKTKEVYKTYNFNSIYALNTANMDNWHKKKIHINILNKNKHKNNFHQILVCLCTIELNSIPSKGFQGKILLKSKLTKEVGHIFAKIKLITDDEVYDIETDSIINCVNNDFAFLDQIPKKYEFIEEELQEKFLIRKIDVLMNLKDNERLIDDNKSKENQLRVMNSFGYKTKTEFISENLVEAILKKEHILIYGIFRFLIEKFYIKEKEFILEFFEHFIANRKNVNILTILSLIYSSKNFALLEAYLQFIHLLVEIIRNRELEDEKVNQNINFEEVFKMLLDNFGFLLESLKDKTAQTFKGLEEIKNSILWNLNTMLALITPNITERLTNIDFCNKIYKPCFYNALKLVTQAKFIMKTFMTLNDDSEISSLTVKVFRKGIQILIDDKTNYIQISDNPEIVSFCIKDLLLNDEQAQSFFFFLKIVLSYYTNYPEVFSNTLLVLIYFSMDVKNPEIARKLLDNIDLNILMTGFDLYRGNLKKIGKNINYFFYKFLSQITEINKSVSDEDAYNINLTNNELKIICNDIIKLFRLKISKERAKCEKGKTLTNFLANKNLELHEVLCCVGSNLTKTIEASLLLCQEKCYYIPSIVEYFFDLNRESVKVYMEKYKLNLKDKIPLYISIIDNTILIFDNILTRNNETKEYFLNVLAERNLTKNKVIYQIRELLDIVTSMFSFNNQRLTKNAENFINNFE
jgi:hypothetical protein